MRKALLAVLCAAAVLASCTQKQVQARGGAGAPVRDTEGAAAEAGFRTVKIGGLTWMAENLNVETEDSWCYDNAESNCKKYGRLYTWGAAVGACTDGWRLPDDADWQNLMEAAGGTRNDITVGDEGSEDSYEFVNFSGASKKLKARSGWNKSGNGTDDYGFSAMPGGYRDNVDNFHNIGEHGNWWSATDYDESDSASYIDMIYADDDVVDLGFHKGNGFSVRCVKGN